MTFAMIPACSNHTVMAKNAASALHVNTENERFTVLFSSYRVKTQTR